MPSVKPIQKTQLKPNKSKSILTPIPSKTQANPTLHTEDKIRVTTRNFNIYKQNLSNFSLSQNQNLFILRLSTSPSIPMQFFSMPIYKLLHHTASEMMMNEIEMVLWSIYLDRYVWKELGNHLKLMLYITAFAVKSYMGCEIEPFLVYLGFKFNHFLEYFNKWLVNSKPKLATSPKEINKKFNFLGKRMRSNEIRLLNVNFVVDSIIEMAPAYSLDKQGMGKSQDLDLKKLERDQIALGSNMKADEMEDDRVQSEEAMHPPVLMVRMDSIFATPSNIQEVHDNNSKLKASFDINSLDPIKELIEEEPLPHLAEEISYFTYYMSQNNS